MQYTPKFRSLVLGGSLWAASAVAAQPPDVVASDSYGNTAGGTGAMLLFLHGGPNSAFGDSTAFGVHALYEGGYMAETAFGAYALQNDGGAFNAAFGGYALVGNKSGESNTAIGYSALSGNVSGNYNTAVGFNALATNETGSDNIAIGYLSLDANTTGNQNVAVGQNALYNSNGSSNTGLGTSALAANTSGSDNTAVGGATMSHNVSGSNNVAVGNNALKNDSAGNANIALGYNAGDNLQGSNNIAIGNTGSTSDSGVVRIGTAGTQTAVYLAGVATTHVTGASVIVTASGQLGVLASSERYKTAIAPIGDRTAKLEALRPVAFHLKNDPRGAVQYGLIAEEVARVYPELVIRNEAGGIEGVRYDELAPMLLNEVQEQAREIRELKTQFAEMRAAMNLKQSVERAVVQR